MDNRKFRVNLVAFTATAAVLTGLESMYMAGWVLTAAVVAVDVWLVIRLRSAMRLITTVATANRLTSSNSFGVEFAADYVEQTGRKLDVLLSDSLLVLAAAVVTMYTNFNDTPWAHAAAWACLSVTAVRFGYGAAGAEATVTAVVHVVRRVATGEWC